MFPNHSFTLSIAVTVVEFFVPERMLRGRSPTQVGSVLCQHALLAHPVLDAWGAEIDLGTMSWLLLAGRCSI